MGFVCFVVAFYEIGTGEKFLIKLWKLCSASVSCSSNGDHQTVIWVAFRCPSYLMCSTANKLSLFYPLTPLTTICKGVVSCSLPYPVCLSAYWRMLVAESG